MLEVQGNSDSSAPLGRTRSSASSKGRRLSVAGPRIRCRKGWARVCCVWAGQVMRHVARVQVEVFSETLAFSFCNVPCTVKTTRFCATSANLSSICSWNLNSSADGYYGKDSWFKVFWAQRPYYKRCLGLFSVWSQLLEALMIWNDWWRT